MKPPVSMKPGDPAEKINFLSGLLADEFLLSVKTKDAHWNSGGIDFSENTFFRNQHKQLDKITDEVAERIRSFGHFAPATMTKFLQLTHLTEHWIENDDGKGLSRALLADHESIIIHLRENTNRLSNDSETSNLILALLETHEKIAWRLREHLK